MKLYIGYLKSHFKAFYYINIIPPINFIVNMKIIMPNGIYLCFAYYWFEIPHFLRTNIYKNAK